MPQLLVTILLSPIPFGFIRLGRSILHALRKRHLRRLWGFIERQDIVFITPYADVDKILPGIQTWDFYSWMELHKFLMTEFRPQGLCSVPSQPPPDTHTRQNNLFLVGGWIPNPMTEQLLTDERVVYHFGYENDEKGHDILKRGDNNFRLSAEWDDERRRVIRDYGIITVARNSYQPDRYTLAICGSFAWGTYCAAMLLTRPNVVRYLRSLGPYFQAICTCEVDEHGFPKDMHLLDLHPDDRIKKPTLVALDFGKPA
jgi:hypothetical protein